jgi:hypothetical protein
MNTPRLIGRYPSAYINNTYICGATGSTGPTDYDFNKGYVKENRNTIIELFNNYKYYEIANLCDDCPLSITDNDPDYIDELTKIVLNYLIKYCYNYNDIEFYKSITSRCKQENIHIDDTNCTNTAIEKNYYDIFKASLEYEELGGGDVADILWYIAAYKKSSDAIQFLEIMLEYGYDLNRDFIIDAIIYNNIVVIEFCFMQNYDVQNAFDSCTNVFIKFETIKLLINNNIDILKNIDNLVKNATFNNDIDFIMFLVNYVPQLDLNKYLNYSCINNILDIMTYLLQNGADIHMINYEAMANANFDTIKFLIKYNCKIRKDILEKHLISCLTSDTIMDNFLFLTGYVDATCIFKHDSGCIQRGNQKTIYYDNFSYSMDILEYIVSKGRIDSVKFLVENYYNLFITEVDRLFIIACANGQNEIAKYLFALDTKLDNKALICGCFFGHLDIVTWLLSLGMDFNNITENLFVAVEHGYSYRLKMYESETYTNLINNNTIFRNDIYNYGGKYIDIVNVLIKYDVPIPDVHDVNIASIICISTDVFKYFINNVDINLMIKISDNRYISLLELAVIICNQDIIKLLLNYGIDPHVKDYQAVRYVKSNARFIDYGIKIDI